MYHKTANQLKLILHYIIVLQFYKNRLLNDKINSKKFRLFINLSYFTKKKGGWNLCVFLFYCMHSTNFIFTNVFNDRDITKSFLETLSFFKIEKLFIVLQLKQLHLKIFLDLCKNYHNSKMKLQDTVFRDNPQSFVFKLCNY